MQPVISVQFAILATNAIHHPQAAPGHCAERIAAR